jgi:hypothetical protein
MPTMTDAGDFEKLPLEIRHEIYRLALVRSEPLVLRNFGGDQGGIGHRGLDNEWARSDKPKVAPVGHSRSLTAVGYRWTRKVWVKVPSKVALLCVNQKIYAEAASVLYSHTKFRFKDGSAMRRFLDLIGDKILYLRDVGIDRHGWTCRSGFYRARRAIEGLAAATSLRTLEVAHADVCPNIRGICQPGVQMVLRLCTPLLDSLKVSYTDKDLNASVLEVIKISAADHRDSFNGYTKEQMTEANIEAQRKLKHSIAEQYEMALE